ISQYSHFPQRMGGKDSFCAHFAHSRALNRHVLLRKFAAFDVSLKNSSIKELLFLFLGQQHYCFYMF
ncbi:MAG: hypothetical protein ACRDCN_00035, partial [Tannerellaceae bacterium]